VGGEFPFDSQLEVSRGGQTERFGLHVELSLRDVRKVLAASLRGVEAGKPVSWPRSPAAGKPRGIALALKHVEVSVAGKARSVLPDSYSMPLVAGAEHKADELDLFAVATAVDVTSLGACKGYSSIGGGGGVRNAGFKFGFDVQVYDHTGKQVAERSFPKPKKTSCPDDLSGKRGETVVLLWAPDNDDVQKWLDSQVQG